MRAEENRGLSTQNHIIATNNNPMVADLIYPPPLWCYIQEGLNGEGLLPSNPTEY